MCTSPKERLKAFNECAMATEHTEEIERERVNTKSHVSLDSSIAGKIPTTAKRNRVLSTSAIDMAKRFKRIVCLGVVLLCVVLGSSNASAEIFPISQAVTLRADSYLEFLTSRGWFSSKEKACEAFSGWYGERWPPGPYNFQVHPQGHLCGVWDFIFASNMCPINSELVENRCECKRGFAETSTPGACTAIPKEVSANSCMAGLLAGHPVAPALGEKFRSEMDFIDGGPSPLALTRTYRSNWGADSTRKVGAFGKAWIHNHEIKLEFATGASHDSVRIFDSSGQPREFRKAVGTANWTAFDSADSFAQTTDGGWTYYRADDGTVQYFDTFGKLQTLTERNSWTNTYSYAASGELTSITNQFGRSLTFSYDSSKRLIQVTLPDLRTVGYSYDATGRLTTVIFPDGKKKTYLYEWGRFLYALTSMKDEVGVHWARFYYTDQGRANATELTGGVDRYDITYPSAETAVITDPLGTARTYSYSGTKSKQVVAGASLPSGIGEADASSRVQDANGLITSETDFKGVVTTTTWDTARRLPLTVTRASGRPEAQTTTTQWHPTFSLPVLITESGRTTAFTHDAVGNVLTRTVTDTAANKAQTWQWTYNASQLVETATEPNGATTTYTYDLRGNVLTSTNALGHVTGYAYDLANRVTSQAEPNGLVTIYTYDARDRLLTQTVGGQQTTTLTYKPYGSVETIALPTGLVLTYTYDPAHRLTGWSNNRGESGSFTLDGMGNRTAEQIKDSSGAVAWNAARTINNINRVSGKTEGPNQTSSFGYDANGELTRSTNGLNQSTQLGLDNLRRVASVTNAANATATLKYNALDAVTEAKDFKGVATGYTRDAQGNATAESSPDTGGATTQYDNLGLPSQIVDALGQATTINRDALGRPTSLVFADGKTTTLRYDLTATSKGYLSEIVDRSGTAEYTRDAFGRVVLKKQTLANGSIQQIGYAYNLNGTLGSIAYPTGATLSHVYDATGRLTGLNWNSTPLVSNITWNPLGQPTGWTWAFTSTDPKLKASRSYDTAGRVTATEFGSYVYDAAGRITSLTQNLYGPADTDPTHDTIANANTTWNVGYDSVGRITSFNVAGSSSNTAGFGYDANGNRSSSTRVVNGLSTSRSYTVPTNGNRLTGFSQTTGGATTSVVYGYNANGDLTGDGLRSYGYDAEGRLSTATTGATDSSPTTRYAHNALGQRVFKTEPLYPPSQGDESDPSFMQSLIAFFKKLWNPSASQAEQLGYSYVYDERGTLVAEIGSGGTNSSGQASYIYLPTANGPMPIAAVINGNTYAVHSDHLNTPRRLSNEASQPVWQWRYSAFGEEEPTMAAKRFTGPETVPSTGATSTTPIAFNLRYPGQYSDAESGLFYNYFRSYDARVGRYSQPDPIGLQGGWSRFGYVDANPLRFIDPFGLDRWGDGQWGPSSNRSAPMFDPRYNDSEAWRWNNNCYSYALNRPGTRSGGPVRGVGGTDPGEPSGAGISGINPNCGDTLDAVRRDGGVAPRADQSCPAGYHGAQLFIRPTSISQGLGDYHWYRQDADGTWSDKQGSRPAKQLGGSPLPPSTYPTQCGTVCLPN